jgi:hypothetical protein
MGTIVLAQAHLPAVLLVPGEGDKEVIVDPTNTQAHALVLQHLQNGDQKPLPDPATKGSKGQERRTSTQSPSSSCLAHLFCLVPLAGPQPHHGQLGTTLPSGHAGSSAFHSHHPDGPQQPLRLSTSCSALASKN